MGREGRTTCSWWRMGSQGQKSVLREIKARTPRLITAVRSCLRDANHTSNHLEVQLRLFPLAIMFQPPLRGQTHLWPGVKTDTYPHPCQEVQGRAHKTRPSSLLPRQVAHGDLAPRKNLGKDLWSFDGHQGVSGTRGAYTQQNRQLPAHISCSKQNGVIEIPKVPRSCMVQAW